MDEINQDSVIATEPKQEGSKTTFDFLEKLTDEDKTKLAEELKVKYLAENKSLKEYKAKIQKEKEEAERLKLEEQGKYKELAEIHEQKVKSYKLKLGETALKESLKEKGVSSGVLNLILESYKNKIELDDNDNITNLQSIMEELETNSPEIFNKSKPSFNLPTNPVIASNRPIAYSEWEKITDSKEKIKIKTDRGVDYSK